MKIYLLENADWEDQRVIYADTDEDRVSEMYNRLKYVDDIGIYPIRISSIDTDSYSAILKREVDKRAIMNT